MAQQLEKFLERLERQALGFLDVLKVRQISDGSAAQLVNRTGAKLLAGDTEHQGAALHQRGQHDAEELGFESEASPEVDAVFVIDQFGTVEHLALLLLAPQPFEQSQIRERAPRLVNDVLHEQFELLALLFRDALGRLEGRG